MSSRIELEDLSRVVVSTLPQGFTLTLSDPDEGATGDTRVHVSVTAGADDPFALPNSVVNRPAGKAAEFRLQGSRGPEMLRLTAEYWRAQSAVIPSLQLRRELKSTPFTVGLNIYFAEARATEAAGNSALAARRGGIVARLGGRFPALSCQTRPGRHAQIEEIGD